jgi:RNA polymerase sigma factor (sigma-70 family)
MQELDDIELLRRYTESNSEEAFGAIVARHINKVYSAALRHTRNPSQAEEITQVVFVILAKKARGLSKRVVLSGWLYQTARLTSVTFLRSEIRRAHREQEAHMQSILNEPPLDETWMQIAPLLDAAMANLNEADRNAVVLRFFDGKSIKEVGAALGTTEDTAKKRLSRALEKQQRFFSKRGVSSTTAIIAGVISANSVQAAPASLVATVTATVAKGATISATITTLVKGTMKTMTWLKLKFAIGVSASVMLAAGVTTVAISRIGSGDDTLTPQVIIEQSQDAYAALTSYSDEGEITATVGKTTVAPHIFSIRLTRPDLYRVEWKQDMGSFVQTGIVWCAGNGNFLKMVAQSRPAKYQDIKMALSAATGISGGASGSIPGTFFKLNWGNTLGAAMQSAKRMPDEKISGVDCYVLTQSKSGRMQTMWIGKQDFLIRQIESDTSAADLKAILDAEAKKHPGMNLPTTVAGDVKSVQTHSNIVMNRKFSPADFAP